MSRVFYHREAGSALMLLPSLLIIAIVFAVAVGWFVMQPPPEQALAREALEPVRQMIERVQRDYSPDYDPRQRELDFG